ncbi:putative phage protein (predicted DNA packaging) [Moryella indoligenes]|uniref:Phage protein (Predicted DNA packaging) n=1 Tax=Moryella indoligenes TaxID=371674 RepID=A0AAE3VC36_9FIRM|nr:head-tail connector protein [Moryella indoligenes]MDQ0153538.1 putative phage protein (predicted DNA packaging) [Moryella indoligenes]
MTLQEVKDYLRVDCDDDDALIEKLIAAAKEYIVSAVGAYDEADSTAKILLAAIVQDMYDNRELMQSEQQIKRRIEYLYQSMILQLQLKHEGASR